MSRNRLLSALRRLADQPVPVRRQRLRERFLDPLWRARDAAIPSLTSRGPGHLEALLAAPLAAAPSDAGLWAALALRYLGRRFDLLGSGWVRVAHGERFAGFDGYGFAPRLAPEVDVDGAWLHGRVDDTNLSVCRRVWAVLPAGHEPIDWQVDFRSGYRWSERTWYSDLQFGDRTGADVKVPWELGRMQHVVHLSLAHAAARAGAPPAGARGWPAPAPLRAREGRQDTERTQPTICSADAAPLVRASSCPRRNTIIVGMERMPCWAAIPCCASVSILTRMASPTSCCAAWTN